MGLYDMNYHLAIDWWMESHQSRRIAATLLFQHTKFMTKFKSPLIVVIHYSEA